MATTRVTKDQLDRVCSTFTLGLLEELAKGNLGPEVGIEEFT
jgi:hypothetical protein